MLGTKLLVTQLSTFVKTMTVHGLYALHFPYQASLQRISHLSQEWLKTAELRTIS